MRWYWEEQAAGYTESRCFSPADARVLELLRPYKRKSLLEIGFGSCIVAQRILSEISDIYYIGLDFAEGFVRIARQNLHPSPPLVKASIADLPFRKSSFDLILEMDTIHHFPRPVLPGIVAGIADLLRSDGRWIIVEDWAAPPADEREELARTFQKKRHTTDSGLEYHPSEEEWQNMVVQSGLEVLQVERIERPLDISRLVDRDDPERELKLRTIAEKWQGVPPTTLMSLFLCRKP